MPQTQSITIQGIPFSIQLPFSEGHVCSSAEAHQLNMARAENIRNSFDKKVKARLAGNPPTEQTLAELRSEFAQLDSTYSFRGSQNGNPAEKLAAELATAKLKAAYSKKGLDFGELDEDERAVQIARVAALPQVREEAERRIAAVTTIAESAMGLAEV